MFLQTLSFLTFLQHIKKQRLRLIGFTQIYPLFKSMIYEIQTNNYKIQTLRVI